MSTYVNVPSGGGGTDLSKLSSGERYMVSVLFISAYDGLINGGYVTKSNDIDWTQVSSAQFTYTTSTASSSQYFYLWFAGDDKIVSVSEYVPSGTSSGSFIVNDIYTAGINGYASLNPSQLGRISVIVKMTSFTTIDGKVHTLDNLNY